MTMRVLCAPNAFKGSLDALGAAAAMARGVALAHGEAVQLPVADGGDGTMDVLLAAAGTAAATEEAEVSGPAPGQRLTARLGWLDGTARQRRRAVVDLAEACGLRRWPAGLPLDAGSASSRGAGELVARAVAAGASSILVGVGGSASTDGGTGLLAALGLGLIDAEGDPLPAGGIALARLARLEVGELRSRLEQVEIEVLCDVDAPLVGPRGAATVFGPQKGAGPEMVPALDAALARLAATAERDAGVPAAMRMHAGAGAAGGCGYGLMALAGARLVPGATRVADAVGLDGALATVDLVLTGEGRLDGSTAAGKAPAEVARRAAAVGVPCVVLAGAVEGPSPAGVVEAVAIGAGLTLEVSQRRTSELLQAAAGATVRRYSG
ncbi:MAG: glycerate kinase [Candidatus Dormibacteria bacterium]